MQYKGKELIEMLPENWDGKSRNMLVWCDDTKPIHRIVCGYDPIHCVWLVAETQAVWKHCAEIPTEAEEDVMKLLIDNENEILELKAENEKLKTKVNELKNSCSYQVYSDMWNEKAKFEGKIANLEKENQELKEKNKLLRAERHEMADSVSRAVWKELMEKTALDNFNTASPGFRISIISQIVFDNVLKYKDSIEGIIDKSKPKKKLRRMTYKELAKWISNGNSEWAFSEKCDNNVSIHSLDFVYYACDENKPVSDKYKIRGWDETEWHEPLIEESRFFS